MPKSNSLQFSFHGNRQINAAAIQEKISWLKIKYEN